MGEEVPRPLRGGDSDSPTFCSTRDRVVERIYFTAASGYGTEIHRFARIIDITWLSADNKPSV
jgi:hypothetical protein